MVAAELRATGALETSWFQAVSSGWEGALAGSEAGGSGKTDFGLYGGGFVGMFGGITTVCALVLTATGILLMFYYRPTVEYAFVDILDLREQVPFGIMREVHRWGAHAMVISVWIHMFRVFMTGSYKPPREFNWVIGVILLVLTLLLSFTGYLLPWDQLSYWAVTVAEFARAVVSPRPDGAVGLEREGVVLERRDRRHVLE